MTRMTLGPHFAAAEFDCHNGQQWPREARQALVVLVRDVLEPMRLEFGPVRVTSGYRPKAYNASVGGAAASYHRYELRYGPGSTPANGVGLAADVVPARGTPAQWARWASARFSRLEGPLWRGRGAAVAYPASGFVHVDSGPARTWAG